jgi:uncharacterized membrane protein YbhN (UPF0104 family)
LFVTAVLSVPGMDGNLFRHRSPNEVPMLSLPSFPGTGADLYRPSSPGPQTPADPGCAAAVAARLRDYLAASASCYLLGQAFSALFWHRLLWRLGQRPSLPATLRAFYVGQLGRYLPGKVWGLFLRGSILDGPGVRAGVAALAATYETLTTMASGALLAALLLLLGGLKQRGPSWKAVALLGLAVIPILPPVFNRLGRWVSAPFRPAAGAWPCVGFPTLLTGLVLTGCGWLLQGASLWAVLQTLSPGTVPATVAAWAHCTALAGLAYAAGFVVLVAPGGLGVREFVLQRFLAGWLGGFLVADEAAAVAVVAALLLRLVWTVAEVLAAVVAYWLPGRHGQTEW